MRAIIPGGRLAALAGEVVSLAWHIDVLELDHPERRFVSALCVYCCEVDEGLVEGPFCQEQGERYARALLMPEEAFAPVAGWADVELAELFAVPLEQVDGRRYDRLAGQRTG